MCLDYPGKKIVTFGEIRHPQKSPKAFPLELPSEGSESVSGSETAKARKIEMRNSV